MTVTSARYFKEQPDVAPTHPIGTGPWQFVSSDPGVEMVLKKAPGKHPWREEPAYDKLIIRTIGDGAAILAQVQSGAVGVGQLSGELCRRGRGGRPEDRLQRRHRPRRRDARWRVLRQQRARRRQGAMDPEPRPRRPPRPCHPRGPLAGHRPPADPGPCPARPGCAGPRPADHLRGAADLLRQGLGVPGLRPGARQASCSPRAGTRTASRSRCCCSRRRSTPSAWARRSQACGRTSASR